MPCLWLIEDSDLTCKFMIGLKYTLPSSLPLPDSSWLRLPVLVQGWPCCWSVFPYLLQFSAEPSAWIPLRISLFYNLVSMMLSLDCYFASHHVYHRLTASKVHAATRGPGCIWLHTKLNFTLYLQLRSGENLFTTLAVGCLKLVSLWLCTLH